MDFLSRAEGISHPAGIYRGFRKESISLKSRPLRAVFHGRSVHNKSYNRIYDLKRLVASRNAASAFTSEQRRRGATV